VADREPLAIAQCAAILRIPNKQAPESEVCDLDESEISAILAQPDRSRVEGQRDHALLSLLYNTGARIQEALNLSPRDIRWEPPFQVRLFGKGRKVRTCPLWPETIDLLKALLRKLPRGQDECLFVNRYGDPLGAAGVRFKLKQYVLAASTKVPSLAGKSISPHAFRHATAVSLVTAGVDVTVIRSWLGHASLNTTNIYARANVETKRKALEKIETRPAKPPRWKREVELLDWLDSL
jgi:site-specific recombinase XerD